MWFLPYFGCVLLGVDSLRGGLAEGNRITSQRLLDQSHAGPYIAEIATYPPVLGLFTVPQVVELLV